MIAWDGGRCVEGLCLAGPHCGSGQVETDADGPAHMKVSPEIDIAVVDGRICEIVLGESVFFEGEQLIGHDILETASILLFGEPGTEYSVLPNGSELAIVAGRRLDYDLELWGSDGLVTSVHLQDYTWIEE